jgi:hypothetical protein
MHIVVAPIPHAQNVLLAQLLMLTSLHMYYTSFMALSMHEGKREPRAAMFRAINKIISQFSLT